MTDLQALFDAGRAAWQRNDLPAAEAALRTALAAAPGHWAIRAALGSVLLKAGHLNEGFRMFDAWRELPERREKVAPRLPFARWRGEPVEGKRVLVWSEDGFGDQIMHARFVKDLMARGAEVSWLCPRELVRLFAEGLGVTALPGDQSADLNCDFLCPSGMLPQGFDLTWETLPSAPYITAPAVRPASGRIGVMTAGNPKNLPGGNRALTPDEAGVLRGLPGAVDLAPEATGAADFHDTAAIIAGLDLVVSVDTAVAHLAGAMGKPVWILVPFVADWRWPDRAVNPWYPGARILRQGPDLSWAPVVARVAHELA